jgi:hypothetical protein
MGNFHISIRGIGVHHNRRFPIDANRMAARFVQEMKDAGHSITSAAITTGGEEDINDPDYQSKRDAVEGEPDKPREPQG